MRILFTKRNGAAADAERRQSPHGGTPTLRVGSGDGEGKRSGILHTQRQLTAAADAERLRSGCGETRDRRAGQRGFTLTEFVIAVAITLLGAGAFFIFTESTGRTLLSLSTQSSHNQSAANAAEFMIARIRSANTTIVDTAGSTLTLGFNDDPSVDSDGDGTRWNDQDHYEQFQFVDGVTNSFGTNSLVLNDRKITYLANTRQTQSTDIVPNSTRRLAGSPIFDLTNSTVFINFGLLTTNATPFSQQIEIRTKALMRNRTK